MDDDEGLNATSQDEDVVGISKLELVKRVALACLGRVSRIKMLRRRQVGLSCRKRLDLEYS